MKTGPDDAPHPAEQEDRVSIREKKITVPLWQIAAHVEKIINNSSKREQYEKDYKNQNLRWMKCGIIFSASFSTISALIAYLTYTVLTSQTTILSNQYTLQENQLRAMRVDQRAWVNIKFKPDDVEAGKPLRGTLKVVNTGKTPAKKISGIASLQIVASNKSPNQKEGILKDTTFSGLLFPGDELLFNLKSRDDKSDLALSKTDLEDLRSGKAYIAVLGKIGYEDIYDTPHWIKFCLWKDFASGTYSAAECVNFNETDKD